MATDREEVQASRSLVFVVCFSCILGVQLILILNQMPRGGKRKGAGRKSTWNNKETCLIRIPEKFHKQLMEIARRLDEGVSLEVISQPKQIPMDFLDGPGPLGQRDLARRFQLRSNGTVGTSKNKFGWRKFAKWSYMHDPDDLHWAFDESIKKYRVIDYLAEVKKEERFSEWS